MGRIERDLGDDNSRGEQRGEDFVDFGGFNPAENCDQRTSGQPFAQNWAFVKGMSLVHYHFRLPAIRMRPRKAAPAGSTDEFTRDLRMALDRKSTRLNSSHLGISY